jgi:hypothetical protein
MIRGFWADLNFCANGIFPCHVHTFANELNFEFCVKPSFLDARVQIRSFVSRIRSDQKNHVHLLNAGHGGIEEIIRAHINAMNGRGGSTGLVKCEVIGTEMVD